MSTPSHSETKGVRRPLPLALALASAALASPIAHAADVPVPSRSTTIAISPDQTRLVNLNHDTDSVTVFQINPAAPGQNALTKLAEIGVGDEPQCVAIHPNNSEAYVTTADGFVSVISLSGANAHTVVKSIPVKSEPRGCALTPSGNLLYVANHTHGSLSVIDTAARAVKATTGQTFGRPYAVAISNDGDTNDFNERVFVTDFYAELIPALAGGPGRPFDTGSRGRVFSFKVGDLSLITPTTLSPLANVGFNADRTVFCTASASLQSTVYCPNPKPVDPTQVPQGAFPNQLHAALIRNGQMFLPSIGAAPEPPVKFNVNVQALVHAIDTNFLQELPANHVNLNAQIKAEVQPADPTASLARLFGNDIVAVDADPAGENFYFVSRGGNYVIRAKLVDGKLNIGAPDNVVRFQTGHIPTGIAVSDDGKRAYTNNEVGRSVSVLNLAGNNVIARDIASTGLPQVGSFEHNALMGKLVFHTALGVPDNGLTKAAIRSIDPLKFRGKQSDNGWSTCASCHPAGLSDGVTWIFADGPRQTLPLDATYSKRAMGHDVRILNWSAVRGNNTDFNNNSRGVQGGTGFVSDPTLVKNHGVTQGVSEALDLETLWIGTIRTLSQTPTSGLDAGIAVFKQNCASCHGGGKWTKSQILYRDDPALVAGAASDPGLVLAADGGGQIQSFTANGKTLTLLENVGTFNPANKLEIKAGNGQRAFGASGFNVPSLLGVRYNAPYFHDGSADTLTQVFSKHALGGGTIANTLSATDRNNLTKFLNTLDGRTNPLRSAADTFRGLP